MHDEVICAKRITRTERSGAVFTDHCGGGRHADGCPLATKPGSIVKQGDDLYVNIAGTRIKLTSDPTLKPGEIHFEQPVPISVTNTCARCDHPFTSSPDPDWSDYHLENEIAAHQERCVIVGDSVRITMPKSLFGREQWVDGTLLSMERNAVDGFDGLVLVHGASTERMKYVGTERSLSWGGGCNTIRRIPRPTITAAADLFATGNVTTEQAREIVKAPSMQSYTTFHCQGRNMDGKQCRETIDSSAAPAPWRCSAHASCTTYVGRGDCCAFCELGPSLHRKAPTIEPTFETHGWRRIPAPVLYDGVTLQTLLDGDEFARQERGGAMWRAKAMTPVQRAAISAHWSAQLRAKLAASAEAERLTVRIDLQEDE